MNQGKQLFIFRSMRSLSLAHLITTKNKRTRKQTKPDKIGPVRLCFHFIIANGLFLLRLLKIVSLVYFFLHAYFCTLIYDHRNQFDSVYNNLIKFILLIN